MMLLELLMRALACDVGRLTNNDSMSSPDLVMSASLTNRESVIRREVADPRITHGRYHAQSGEGTASSRTVEFLLECTSIASSRILAPRYLHVVRHGPGWHDGA